MSVYPEGVHFNATHGLCPGVLGDPGGYFLYLLALLQAVTQTKAMTWMGGLLIYSFNN